MFHVKHSVKKIIVNRSAVQAVREIYKQNEAPLEMYIDLLLEWNKKINLVSRNVSRETLREHVAHSLLPVALNLTQKHAKWIDSGTGGGLPGIPLAICQHDLYWILNDNVKKKMRAVSNISNSLGLENVETMPYSISMAELQKGTGIITKHAFKIKDLLRLLGSKPWKTIILWKGVRDAEEEILRSGKRLNVTIYSFNFGENEPFYEGKGIIKIER